MAVMRRIGEMESLRRYYGVPAYRGRQIVFTGEKFPVAGRIISAREHKLYIPCPLDRDGDPLGQAQIIASEAL
jgi:hypothetical protein